MSLYFTMGHLPESHERKICLSEGVLINLGYSAFKDSSHCSVPFLHPQDGNSLALYYGLAVSPHCASISSHLTKNWTPIGALCPELPNNICPFIESMEVKGHLAINQTERALKLMRLSWGWYLNNPDGTGSTCVEGYLADGTWYVSYLLMQSKVNLCAKLTTARRGYRAASGYGGDYSYTSHAHGWSTGPTHALSTFVVGLQLLSPGGKNVCSFSLVFCSVILSLQTKLSFHIFSS